MAKPNQIKWNERQTSPVPLEEEIGFQLFQFDEILGRRVREPSLTPSVMQFVYGDKSEITRLRKRMDRLRLFFVG